MGAIRVVDIRLVAVHIKQTGTAEISMRMTFEDMAFLLIKSATWRWIASSIQVG
jgi:hypothetical protein